jgi:hypothetical protein
MVPITQADVRQAFANLRSYDFGQSTEPLDRIDAYLRAAFVQTELRLVLEKELIAALDAGVPPGALKFVCQKLWSSGTDTASAALVHKLTDRDIHVVEAACFAIGQRPSQKADEGLRAALARAEGMAQVALIQLAADRRDPGCVPILSKIATAPARLALAKIAAAAPPDDGFRPLFNGHDLSDFDVDTAGIWSVRNGVIIGRSPGLKYNEFLRTKQQYQDFTLHAGLRLIDGAGNSGFQFRSKAVPDSHEVEGYEADAGERYWGSLYDESRRKKTLAGPDDKFLDALDPAAWHSYVVTAHGDHIVIELDGVRTVDFTEAEPGIPRTGFIALQVHAQSTPVEMWFKDLRISVPA